MDIHITHHFETADKTLAALIPHTSEFSIKKSDDPFFSLIESIISQQLSVKAGDTIVKRFFSLFPNNKLSPELILSLPKESIRNAGLSWNKVSYIQNVAVAVQDGSLNFTTLTTAKDEEVIAELIKIKGIGRWTAEMFLIFTLGREDVFSPGDVGLQNAIQKEYKLKQKPTRKQMEQLSNTWKPYRSYACMLLWRSLNNE
jgi:DNA-3-methyladenine glycosylase II